MKDTSKRLPVAEQIRKGLEDAAFEFHHREYERLRAELEASYQASRLPEGPSARPALNDLLVRLRLRGN